MDIENVPQDNISTYGNNKKAIYARDKSGKLCIVGSTGWSAEEIATIQAVKILEKNAKKAYCAVKQGKKSPLYYYMYAMRMDLQVLSESTGFFKWRIKLDFNPKIFEKISNKRLSIYADALGKTPEQLKTMEKQKYDCNNL